MATRRHRGRFTLCPKYSYGLRRDVYQRPSSMLFADSSKLKSCMSDSQMRSTLAPTAGLTGIVTFRSITSTSTSAIKGRPQSLDDYPGVFVKDAGYAIAPQLQAVPTGFRHTLLIRAARRSVTSAANLQASGEAPEWNHFIAAEVSVEALWRVFQHLTETVSEAPLECRRCRPVAASRGYHARVLPAGGTRLRPIHAAVAGKQTNRALRAMGRGLVQIVTEAPRL